MPQHYELNLLPPLDIIRQIYFLRSEVAKYLLLNNKQLKDYNIEDVALVRQEFKDALEVSTELLKRMIEGG